MFPVIKEVFLNFRRDIPGVLYRIIIYIGKIYPNTIYLMFFYSNVFLHWFFKLEPKLVVERGNVRMNTSP